MPPRLPPAPAPTAEFPTEGEESLFNREWLENEVLPLLCPACKGQMRIVSFMTLPSTVERILLHLHPPHEPPRLSPARGPPELLE